ncbi:MAG: STAS domain-containing protein [Fibrobacterota bacterium]
MKDLKIITKSVGNALIVRHTGNFDFDLDNITEDLIQEYVQTRSHHIVLDMKAVVKFPSAAINRLVKILRTVDGAGGKLYLVNVPEKVLKILSMVNIVGRFTLYHSEDEIAAIHGEQGAAADITETAEPSRPSITFSSSAAGYHHTIQVTGAFVDGAETDALADTVNDAINRGARNITLDLQETFVFDSISVGQLLALSQRCQDKGVTFRVINANEIVAHVLNENEVSKALGL